MKLEVITREPRVRQFETPLLFVHGTGHGAWCWDEHFLSFFAVRGFAAHAVSLRGHGRSEGAENLKRSSISDYVSDVRRVAETLDVDPIVIGHSLGGLVVLKYLEKHAAPAGVLVAPSPSEGMFLSGMRIQFQNPLLMTTVALKQDYAVMFSTPSLAKKFLFSPSADETAVAGYCRRFGPESYRAALEMIFNLPRPEKINVPLLVVGAENDALVPRQKIVATAKKLRGDVKMFPDIAHDMMLEAGWQPVAEHIADWLEGRVS